MRMCIQDWYRDESGQLRPLQEEPSGVERCGGYESAEAGQKELLRRWKDLGATKYRNGVEIPNCPQAGMLQRIWFE